MTDEKLSTYEKFLAKVRQYKSYDAAIELIQEEQENKLFGLAGLLKDYIIEEEVLKGMSFSVRSGDRELSLNGAQIVKDNLGALIDENLSYSFNVILMGFEREKGKYVHAKLELNRFGTYIRLPMDINRDELKKLRDKYEFVIDVDYLSESVRKSLRAIEKVDSKIKRFSV